VNPNEEAQAFPTKSPGFEIIVGFLWAFLPVFNGQKADRKLRAVASMSLM
jgi:hypothetical protein